MNEKNLETLEKQMLYTGMGEIPREELIKNLKEEKPEFQIQFSKKYGDDEVHAVLNFKKSAKSDNYFYNSFDLTVIKAGIEVSPTQTFKTEYGNSYSLKEGYNMMMGRSVLKNFVKVDRENKDNNKSYQAWAYLDFKNVDANGNFKIIKKGVDQFNLADVLKEHPIKELLTPKYNGELMDSLERGNRQSVTFTSGEQEEKRHIEANAKFNTINIYDANMNKISLNTKVSAGKEETVSEGKDQSEKSRQSEKTNAAADNDAGDTGDGPAKPAKRKRNTNRVG